MSNGAIIKKTYIYENIDLRSVTLVKGGRSTFPLFISNLHKALIYQQLTESPYLSMTYRRLEAAAVELVAVELEAVELVAVELVAVELGGIKKERILVKVYALFLVS